jgi:hypothetical protein
MGADRPREFRAFDPTADEPVDLVWPTLIRRPAPKPPLIYLDLNHWIGLSQAAKSHAKGARYRRLLETCRNAREDGTAIFPLSGTHYMEVSKNTNSNQRADLAAIMEELSGFTSLTSRSLVMRLELDHALTQLVGRPSSAPPREVSLLGWGSSYALGRSEHPLDAYAGRIDPQVLGFIKLEFERDVLAGPQDYAAERDLRSRGWRPGAAVEVAQKRADQQIELFEALNNTETPWRRGRLVDVIAARELTIELIVPFVEGLGSRGTNSARLFEEGDRQGPRRFTRSMPSSAVAIEMKTLYHRNVNSRWNTQTIFDIDAMALSVPYCDVVLTENHGCETLRRSLVYQDLGTTVLWQPEELDQWLKAQR